MFPLSGKASVFGYGGPAVRKDAKFFPSGVDHRFDREDHAGLHDSTGAELAVMADLRILVEADTDSVTAEFTHDAAALRLDKIVKKFKDQREVLAKKFLADVDADAYLSAHSKAADEAVLEILKLTVCLKRLPSSQSAVTAESSSSLSPIWTCSFSCPMMSKIKT